MYADRITFRLHFGGKAKPLNIHHLADIFWVEPGIARGDIAAHRVRNDADGSKVQLVDQLRQIIHKGRHFVIAVG